MNNWKGANDLEEQIAYPGMVLWKTVENALLCNIFNVQVLATPAMILRKLLLHDSELQKDELIRYYKGDRAHPSST